MEAIVTKNWADSWNEVASNSGCPALLNPLEINLVVKKELRNYKIGTCINFLLQVSDVIFSRGRLEMSLRVARDANTEEVTIDFLDVANKVHGMVKAVFYGLPVSGSSRRVTL